MKKHKKIISIQPKLNGKKELERQARVQAAQQTMRLYSFISILLMIFSAWRESSSIAMELDMLPVNERRYIKMQTAKCKKLLETAVKLLHKRKKWPGEDSPFFKDTSDKLTSLIDRIKKELPEGYWFIHVHSILTYIFAVALADWWDMSDKEDDEIYEVRQETLRFANHIIQNDSPLLKPMNKIFWETRDFIHSHAPLPIYDFNSFPEGTAEYERRHQKTIEQGSAVA